MDHFGIGAAVEAAAIVYFQAARRCGRTTLMLHNLKDGDRVVFSSAEERLRVERLCRERGLDVKCLLLPVDRPARIYEYGTPKGRTIFDHGWIEDFYLRAIRLCANDIDKIERETSGWTEDHEKTRRQAAEWKASLIPLSTRMYGIDPPSE